MNDWKLKILKWKYLSGERVSFWYEKDKNEESVLKLNEVETKMEDYLKKNPDYYEYQE